MAVGVALGVSLGVVVRVAGVWLGFHRGFVPEMCRGSSRGSGVQTLFEIPPVVKGVCFVYSAATSQDRLRLIESARPAMHLAFGNPVGAIVSGRRF